MRVLTYVNGILTVIRNEDFYKKEESKPDFITGSNFYYEPTLETMDDAPLSDAIKVEADNFIDNFVFPETAQTTVEPRTHCIADDGRYIGFIINDQGYKEVPTAPTSNTQIWYNDAWAEAVIIDKDTKYYKGRGNKIIENGIHIPLLSEIPIDFDDRLYYWNETTSSWEITLDNAKAEKKKSIKLKEVEDANLLTNFTAYLEPTSYKLQEDEANAYLADNSISTPFLDNLVVERGLEETVQELAEKIIEKATTFKEAYGKILGKFQKKVREIDNAETVQDVLDVTWDS